MLYLIREKLRQMRKQDNNIHEMNHPLSRAGTIEPKGTATVTHPKLHWCSCSH